MPGIDLNADVGEGAGEDAAVLDIVTSASVACGFHAGDPSTMHRTIEDARRRSVVVGAHPSYDDRQGFGRRVLDVAPDRLADEVLYQVGALDGVAARCDTRVRYVKAHGALYHRMDEDARCARVVAEAVRAYGGLVLLVRAGSPARSVAEDLGVEVATEAFADRGYLPDGRLVGREEPGALVTDPDHVAERATSLALDGRVRAVDGSWVKVRASSICVHGDTPGASVLARAVAGALTRAGVELRPFVS